MAGVCGHPGRQVTDGPPSPSPAPGLKSDTPVIVSPAHRGVDSVLVREWQGQNGSKGLEPDLEGEEREIMGLRPLLELQKASQGSHKASRRSVTLVSCFGLLVTVRLCMCAVLVITYVGMCCSCRGEWMQTAGQRSPAPPVRKGGISKPQLFVL